MAAPAKRFSACGQSSGGRWCKPSHLPQCHACVLLCACRASGRSYFELALGLNVEKSSLLTLIPYIAMTAMMPLVGPVADGWVKKGMKLTDVRKLCQVGLQSVCMHACPGLMGRGSEAPRLRNAQLLLIPLRPRSQARAHAHLHAEWVAITVPAFGQTLLLFVCARGARARVSRWPLIFSDNELSMRNLF